MVAMERHASNIKVCRIEMLPNIFKEKLQGFVGIG